MNFPGPQYRRERGLIWPAADRECARAAFSTLEDCDAAIGLCRGRALAVQAGGNAGAWALHLSQFFARVVTFEPDPVNFAALVANCAGREILCMPAALGQFAGSWCDLDRIGENSGAHQVKPGRSYPVISLDAMQLDCCDLIYLDVEGYESNAIYGARETIARFRPVIAFEDKGLSERYGVSQGATETIVESAGYRVVARRRRDVIMVPIDA